MKQKITYEVRPGCCNMIAVAFFFLLFSLFFFAQSAFAVCPVCTLAVGAGIGLSRYFGVDDIITGLWIGAMIIASGLWLATFLERKKVAVPNREVISTIAMLILIVAPLYLKDFFGNPLNKVLGVDKLALGIFLGLVTFIISQGIENFLRRKNQGTVYFPYQKVIVPVSLLLVLSLALYLTI